MSLGDRLFLWLRQVWGYALTVPPLLSLIQSIDFVKRAFANKPPDAASALIGALMSVPSPTNIAMALGISAATGKPIPAQFGGAIDEARKMIANPSGYLSDKVTAISTDPALITAANAYYGAVNSLILTPLRDLATRAEDNPFGVIGQLTLQSQIVNLIGGAVGVAVEIAGAGQIEGVTSFFERATELAALPEIQKLTLEPLLSTGIGAASERYFNKFYRPSRLAPMQMLTLQALGKVSGDYAADEIAREGYRDADIELMRELLYDRLDASTYIRARDIGLLDDGALYSRLLSKRFKDEDAKLLIDLAAHERVEGWGERIFSLALRLYGKYQIDDDGLARIARSSGFPQERIDFEIDAARMLRKSESTDLSVGEIEAAFKNNILSEVEATNYLVKLQIDSQGIPVLLGTWRAQQHHAPLRLNASELTAAFHDGIISADAMASRLRELGWSDEDTRILVRIAQWRAPAKPRPLSEGIIVTAYHHKIISHDDAVELLKKLEFSEEDAKFIIRAETILPTHKQAELDVSDIAKLVELGELTKENALGRYRAKGYSADDAELLLKARTTKLPPAPKQSKPPKVPPMTPIKKGAP